MMDIVFIVIYNFILVNYHMLCSSKMSARWKMKYTSC